MEQASLYICGNFREVKYFAQDQRNKWVNCRFEAGLPVKPYALISNTWASEYPR